MQIHLLMNNIEILNDNYVCLKSQNGESYVCYVFVYVNKNPFICNEKELLYLMQSCFVRHIVLLTNNNMFRLVHHNDYIQDVLLDIDDVMHFLNNISYKNRYLNF